MLRPLIRLTFVLVIAAMTAVFAARVIGDAQPPRAWLTWEASGANGVLDIYLWDNRRIVNLTRDPEGWEFDFAWSYDGRLAWQTQHLDTNDVYIWDGSIHALTRYADTPYATKDGTLAWSHDGRLAWAISTAGESSNEVYQWDGTAIQYVCSSPGRVLDLMWSADGRLAWTFEVNETREIIVWDGRDDCLNIGSTISYNPVWSADGRLAFMRRGSDSESEIYVWDGENTLNISQHPDRDSNPQWLADGRLEWSSGLPGSGDIYSWDGEFVTSRHVETSPDDIVHESSPDGRSRWEIDPRRRSVFSLWEGDTPVLVDQPLAVGGFDLPNWSPEGRLAWGWSNARDIYGVAVWDEQGIFMAAAPGLDLIARLEWSPPMD